MSVPLSDTELAAIDADVQLAHEGKLIGVPRGAERFEAAVRVADFHSRTLLAEVHRLRKAARDHDRSLDEIIDERDYAQSMADKLAAAIAPEDVLGEHSDGNSPWQNALDWAPENDRTFKELLAEVDRLRTDALAHRTQVIALEGAADRAIKRAGELQAALQDAVAKMLSNQVERDEARAQVRAASTVKCWTNEDGRRFVFAEDLAFALGYTPTAAAPAGSGADQ